MKKYLFPIWVVTGLSLAGFMMDFLQKRDIAIRQARQSSPSTEIVSEYVCKYPDGGQFLAVGVKECDDTIAKYLQSQKKTDTNIERKEVQSTEDSIAENVLARLQEKKYERIVDRKHQIQSEGYSGEMSLNMAFIEEMNR